MGVEPNWIALVLFCVVWGACCIAFLTLIGMLPLSARPNATRGAGGSGLIFGNLVLLAALALATGLFAEARLRWTTIVVAGGLILLFSPTAFDAWPRHFRDSRLGLSILGGLQLAMIGLLLLGGRLAASGGF